MKVCEHCGDEIFTKDGDNKCRQCERASRGKRKLFERNIRKLAMEYALESCGLVKVKGAMGGTYWE